MSRRRGTQHRRPRDRRVHSAPREPAHSILDHYDGAQVLAELELGIYVDERGYEHVVHAPELFQAMRDACPCCNGTEDEPWPDE